MQGDSVLDVQVLMVTTRNLTWHQFIKNVTNLLLQTGLHYSMIFINKISHYWDILHSFCLSILSKLVYFLVLWFTCIPPCVQHRDTLILDLRFFIKLNKCSQWQLLPNTDYINKICFLISGNYFLSNRMTQYYKNCTEATQSTSAGRVWFICWECLYFTSVKGMQSSCRTSS